MNSNFQSIAEHANANANTIAKSKNFFFNPSIVSYLPIVSYLALASFVLSLQFQWIGKPFGAELKCSVSDFILPILFLIYSFNLLKEGFLTFLKAFIFPLWFFSFTVWLSLSIGMSYFEMGTVSSWAFVNKFLGWWALMFYFFMGNLIVRRNPVRIEWILKTLFISSAAISLYTIGSYLIIYRHGSSFNFDDNGRFIGFLANANAYGLFSAFVVLLQIPFLLRYKLFSPIVSCLLLLPNLIVLFHSGSRTAMLALFTGCMAFVTYNFKDFLKNKTKTRKILLMIIISGFLISLFDMGKTNTYLYHKITKINFLDHAAAERIESALQAIHWWLEKPVMGLGLGGFLRKQEQENINPIMTLHNTPLWLLTEIGAIGLLLYGVFLYWGRKKVYERTQHHPEDAFAKGMLIIFPAFIIASLTTEIFYQRYIWFFLGLILAQSQNPDEGENISFIKFVRLKFFEFRSFLRKAW